MKAPETSIFPYTFTAYRRIIGEINGITIAGAGNWQESIWRHPKMCPTNYEEGIFSVYKLLILW